MRVHVTAVLLVSALALAGCGSDDTAAGPGATPLSAPTASPSATETEPEVEPEPAVTPDDARVVTLTYAGGEATGDVGRTEVTLGESVRLTVTSDIADEVHVHGFDLNLAVSPGQAAQLEFVADRPGVFEVELHDARRVLTRLQIS